MKYYCDLLTEYYCNKCQDMGEQTACARLEVMKLWSPTLVFNVSVICFHQ